MESSPTYKSDNPTPPSGSNSTREQIPTDYQDPIFDTDQSIMHESKPGNIDLEQDEGILLPTHRTPNNRVQNLLDQATNMSKEFGTSLRERHRKMACHMQESTAHGLMKNFNQAMQASAKLPNYDTSVYIDNDFDARHDYKLQLQEWIQHTISFHAENMGDIMYLHQALQQQDASEFVKAVVKEVNSHVEQKHWRLIEHSKIPKGMDPLPAVWAMRRKRNLTTYEITKYKARLNINGGKQEKPMPQ